MVKNKIIIRALKTLYFALLAAIIIWGVPVFSGADNSTSIASELRKVSGPFFRWSGLWQGWSMFAPNPSNQNISVQVSVEFHDGTYDYFTLPQLHAMTRWDAYRSERHRKFVDNVRRTLSRHLWPHMANYYKESFSKQKAVKRIDLIRWWAAVEKPDFDHPPPPPPSYLDYENSFIFYTAKYPKP